MLSIITITYKDMLGLERTVASLKPLMNSQVDWEHLIVDSSPLESKAVIDALPRDWPLVYLQQEPLGIYAAFNLGIEQAQGTILWFLNSGDCLHDVQVLVDLIGLLKENTEIDLVVAAANRVRDGVYQYRWRPGKSFFRKMLGAANACHQGMLYRRRVFSKVGLFSLEFGLNSDYEHMLRYLIANLNIITLDSALADFDVTGKSSQNPKKVFFTYRKIYKSHASNFSWQTNILHEIFWLGHLIRIGAIELFAKTPVDPLLRRFWHWWQRRDDGR